MPDEKTITGKVTKIGEVRQNSTGDSYNFFLMIEGLGNGVYFFGTQDDLTTLAESVDTEHMFKLSYSEDPKGIKGKEITQVTVEEQTALDKIEAEKPPKEPTAKVIYCRWDNTSRELTAPQMAQYTKDFLTYASGLYKLINEDVQDEHMCGKIFEKMCQPLQYYIEDQLRIEDANKG